MSGAGNWGGAAGVGFGGATMPAYDAAVTGESVFVGSHAASPHA